MATTKVAGLAREVSRLHDGLENPSRHVSKLNKQIKPMLDKMRELTRLHLGGCMSVTYTMLLTVKLNTVIEARSSARRCSSQ